MSVDFSNAASILVIHGVQTGEDGDLRQHQYIEQALTVLLKKYDAGTGGNPVPFAASIFKYEDINDDATYLVRRVLASMTGNAIVGWVVDQAVDLVADVLLAIRQSATYDQIKAGFRQSIQTMHAQGKPVYIVAHSLGSFYAFEVMNDLMKDGSFSPEDKCDWPVHGLVTIGSPLGLELFDRDVDAMYSRIPGQAVTSRVRFPWRNYWDAQDPVVTAHLLGYPRTTRFMERFDRQQAKAKGWDIRSREVNSGTSTHLFAHTAYWQSEYVAQGILNMMYDNYLQE